jgi:hypothetical protein
MVRAGIMVLRSSPTVRRYRDLLRVLHARRIDQQSPAAMWFRFRAPGQWRVASFLATGPATAEEIGACLGMSKGAVWAKLYALERFGALSSIGHPRQFCLRKVTP